MLYKVLHFFWLVFDQSYVIRKIDNILFISNKYNNIVFLCYIAFLLNRKKKPSNICLFNIGNSKTKTGCKICSKITIKTLEKRQ